MSLSSLAKIARLYYVSEMQQKDIARKMNISVASVSRALQKAKELGIVKVSINDPDAGTGELEISMEKRWGINECLLVPRGESLSDTFRAMADRTTELLGRILKRGDTVGVSWGETLKSIGEHMGSLGLSGIDVVPVVGAMGTVETGIYPNSIAREFAQKIGGTSYLMNTPALVDTPEIRESLQRDSNFQMVREKWNGLTTVLLSVSSLEEETSAFRRGIFSRTDMEETRGLGGVCATNFSFLDVAGREIDAPLSQRITNMRFGEFRVISQMVVIAAGDHKVEALRAVLNSGLVKILITDRESARLLIE